MPKKRLPYIKKHIFIPLVLCLLVILSGLYMTFTDAISYGRAKEYRIGQDRRNATTISYPVTGPQVIMGGIIMASIVTFIWAKTKK